MVTSSITGIARERERARQLLHFASVILMLASRTVSKGHTARFELTTDVRVLQLDLEDTDSIVSFTAMARKTLHIGHSHLKR